MQHENDMMCPMDSHNFRTQTLYNTSINLSFINQQRPTMSLSRFNPFTFPTIFDADDMFFGPPATFFPRDLDTGRGTATSNKSFWRHPGYEVHQDDKNYVVSVDVPGVRPEDMNVDVEDNTLRVHGGRKTRTQDGLVSESKFDYRLSMGEQVDMDKLTAHLDHGVLSLTAPKIVLDNKRKSPRSIQIANGPAPSMKVVNDEEKKD